MQLTNNKFFANKNELILMLFTVLGLLYMLNLSVSASHMSETILSICMGLLWVYLAILSFYYIKFF